MKEMSPHTRWSRVGRAAATPLIWATFALGTPGSATLGLGSIALGGFAFATSAQAADAPAQTPSESEPNPRVRVTTNMGSFVVELFEDRAPLTVETFRRFVSEGQYTHTLIHRVIANFVIQGGGHEATPPDYKLKPVRLVTLPGITGVPNESGNGLQNKRGTIGLARALKPHSGNCQFYINLVDNPELDPLPTRWGYAVFGQVIQGMDVVDRIGVTPTGSNCPDEHGGKGPACEFKSDWPLKPVVIESIEELPAGAVLQSSPSAPAPTSTTPPVLAPK